MQVDFKKELISLNQMNWNQSATLLVEGDVIVPDIKPDIREILLAEANAVVTGQDCAEGRLHISGTVNLRILYVPEEEDALPKCMDTKFDFKDSLDMPADAISNISVQVDTEHIEFTLINSRKLNMKVVVSVRARGYEQRELTFLTDVPENTPLKIRKKPLSAYQIVADTSRDIVITEVLEVPAAKPDMDEIMKLSAKPIHGDCKIMSGKILLKGSLLLSTLYCGMDTEAGIQNMEHEISFSEMVDIPGLEDDCLCHVTYRIQNIYYSIKEDMNGDPRLISLDVVLRADIMASHTRNIQMIDDCYSISGEADMHSERIRLDELLSEGVSHESIKEILTIPEGVPTAGAVYSLDCKPKVQEIQITGDKMIVRGKLTAFVLYGCADAKNPMYSLVGEFDFEHSVPVDGLDENAMCECHVAEQGISFTLNAASEIELRCVLEFYTRAMRKTEMALMTDCEIREEEEEAARRGLVIYFVQRSDSLWDIAKRYKTDEESIASLNKLEGTALLPGQKILIPGA